MAQCNLSNATSCLCPNGSQICDLLPDLQVSEDLLLEVNNNPEEPGLLAVSVSTPNIGYGPLRILPTDSFVCGIDTIYMPGGLSACPDGSFPSQIIKQRVYQKAGTQMQYYDRFAGTMTYHPTHNHMHVDDWGTYSIREEVPGTDPLSWPIIAGGAKLGFCLMDFGSCDTYTGYCRGSNGEVMGSANIPNYGLGGGTYTCGSTSQGITTGWTDIYYHFLDEMQIEIPEGTCNGSYFLVVDVDPLNHFLEIDETNNATVVPITLNQQSIAPDEIIDSNDFVICPGESVLLEAIDAISYQWSTGENTGSIEVNMPGIYWVDVETDCGIIQSTAIEVEWIDVDPPLTNDINLCGPQNVLLEIESDNQLNWYSDEDRTNLITSGTALQTDIIYSDTSFYISQSVFIEGESFQNPPSDNTFGNGGLNNPNSDGYLIFDALTNFELKSVKVFATGASNRTIELRNEIGTVLQSITVFIPDGESRVDLDFNIPAGANYQLGTTDFPSLFRNNVGVFYPYTTPDVCSIHDTNNGGTYYYYFYDWEIQLPSLICESLSTPLNIFVDEGIEVEILNTPQVISSANPITVQVNPPGGTLNGPGIILNAFNPALAGPGQHTITYEYNDPVSGCAGLDEVSILVVSLTYNFVNYNLGVIAP